MRARGSSEPCGYPSYGVISDESHWQIQWGGVSDHDWEKKKKKRNSVIIILRKIPLSSLIVVLINKIKKNKSN